ncbi:hypothetical protein CJJ23_01550 [Mycoplasmopsis agassizii]|uniref:Aminoglycoside phosphotransferase domain-containing protein n=1 Tax=Mycoplasmopsis agassizii TaxID=33922 RepID=A0A269TJ19_9BACT|nr:phosphotransferase [Mycoplasmopsis agassizii]PAK21459.1 hypothetical protein CJJ23_01550 [Mycoplasmopsis agassizii]
MEKINKGMTNNSYRDGNTFYQVKTNNSLNHRIDYQVLGELDFVPKLIENTSTYTRWDFVVGQEFTKSEENLKKLAKMLAQIHNSKLEFPKFNHRDRVNTYRKKLAEKNLKIDVIDAYFKRINLILRNMDTTTPVHNDLFPFNLIVDKDQKIWIVDWEYASLGDKHFDLAYFIESGKLTDQEEDILLDNYGSYDYEKIIQHKIFVNYLVVLWVNVQPVKYFDDQEYINRIYELDKFLNEYRTKHNLK